MIRLLISITLLFSGTSAWGAPLVGKLVQRGSGEPIEDVQIIIEDSVIATTGRRGRFEADVAEGHHTIVFDSVDHVPKTIEIDIPIDRPIRVYLDAVEGPLEIVVEAFKPSSHATHHRVDAEMAFETPGTHDDSVRLVQSLPGVMVQREFSPSAGDLSVRASKPGDNRYFLDGIEVPYLYHFNQYASVFPTSQIGELHLYPSTFGAPFGDAIGAVIDANTRTERPEAVHGGAHFNTIMLGGNLRVPIGRKMWASGSLRRSYHDIAGNSNPQYLIWPRFSDFSARLEHGDKDNGTGLFVFGARDRYTRAAGELDLMDPLEVSQNAAFSFQRNFSIWGLRHRFRGEHLQGRMVLGLTNEDRIGIFQDIGFETMTTRTLTHRLDVESSTSETTGWKAGWEFRLQDMHLAIDGAGPMGLLVQDEAPGLARGVDVDLRNRRLRLGTYGQLRVAVGAVRLFPGVRLQLDPMTKSFSASPRLSARWQVAQQTAFKMAVGHYAQTPPTEWLLPGTGNPSLRNPDSWQATVGVEQTVANRLELHLDGYYKAIQHPIVAGIGAPPSNGDTGRIAGVEAVVRYRLRDRFFMWGWFGWSSSRVKTTNTVLIGDYDQPISGGLVVSWDPSRNFNLALRYRIGSGLPYTPVVDGVYNAVDDRYEPTPGVINSARMPLYQKVDASIGYTAYFNRWTLNLRAELWVVPKSSTQLYPTHNFDFTETEWVTGIPIMPLIGAKATF